MAEYATGAGRAVIAEEHRAVYSAVDAFQHAEASRSTPDQSGARINAAGLQVAAVAVRVGDDDLVSSVLKQGGNNRVDVLGPAIPGACPCPGAWHHVLGRRHAGGTFHVCRDQNADGHA